MLATDIVDATSNLSVLHVVQHGVSIGSGLPSNVVFEDLVVTDVQAALVNGVPTASWIPDRPDAQVHVNQPVAFKGDLTVVGSSTLKGTVNNVNLVTLRDTSLLTTGDQVISGHINVASVTATR